MAQYKDGNYIVKDGEIYEVQIDIPRMMGAEVIHIALKDFKKQTNADRIRRMSDEELAEVISGLGDCDTCYLYHRRCSMNISCKDAVLEWLRKEAEDG